MWMRQPNTTTTTALYETAYYASQHQMTFPPVFENIVEEGVWKGWKILVAIDAQDLLAVVDGTGNPVDSEMQFPEDGELGYWPLMFELVDADDERNRVGNWWEVADATIFGPVKAGGGGFFITSPNYRTLPGVALGEAVATNLDESGDKPFTFSLDQNYPNPFNPSTLINFSIPQASNVRLDVFNMLGQRVASLVNGEALNAGSHSVNFNAAALSTGVYIYRLQANGNTLTRKMTLIK
jgi:hypothetical protein